MSAPGEDASTRSESPRIEARGDDVLLWVRAAPGASRDGVSGLHGDALKVAVSAPAQKGRANKALVAVVAKALGLRRSAVSVESGDSSRDKIVRLREVAVESVRERLRELLAPP